MTERPEGDASVAVESYLGFKGQPTPEAFRLNGHRLEVRTIAGQWETARHLYYRVGASDGHRYVLRLDQEHLSWELVMREE